MVRLVLLHFLARSVAASALKVGVKLSCDCVFSNLEELKGRKRTRNQETKPHQLTVYALSQTCFSVSYSRWREHGSILRESAAHSLGVFCHQIQLSSVRWSLFVPVPGERPFGTCTSCGTEGDGLSPPTPGSTSQRLQESMWEEGRHEHWGALWWEYQSYLYFPMFQPHEKATEMKWIWVGESWPLT